MSVPMKNAESDEQTMGTEQTEEESSNAGRRHHIVLALLGIKLPCTGIDYDGCVKSLLKIGTQVFDVVNE